MKKITYVLMILLGAGLLLMSCGQGKKSKEEKEGKEVKEEQEENVKVPETVQKAFQAKFAGAKEVEWKTEEEGEYEAEFSLNNVETSASFDASGNWKETETKVNYATLPSSVLDTLSVRFRDYKVEDKMVEKTETPEGTFWEVELKKGEQEVEVVFKDDGTVVKQEAEEEGEEEVGEASGEHEKGEKEDNEEEEH